MLSAVTSIKLFWLANKMAILLKKKMHLIFVVPYIDAGNEQPEPKCSISQYFPCRETKKKRREIEI